MALGLEERNVKALEVIAKAAVRTADALEAIRKVIDEKLEAVAEEVAGLNATVDKKGS
jgi:hypothetical protein